MLEGRIFDIHVKKVDWDSIRLFKKSLAVIIPDFLDSSFHSESKSIEDCLSSRVP